LPQSERRDGVEYAEEDARQDPEDDGRGTVNALNTDRAQSPNAMGSAIPPSIFVNSARDG